MIKKKIKTKECPECHKKKLGAKVRTCPNKKCGHKFIFQKIIKNAKKCSNCFADNFPRAKECSACNFKFPEKKKSGYQEVPKGEWKKLRRGQIIYLRKGSKGPFFEGEKGRILMGYRGQFNIKYIDREGIIAYSPVNGFAFIYMGPNKLCKQTMVTQRRYRIFTKN